MTERYIPALSESRADARFDDHVIPVQILLDSKNIHGSLNTVYSIRHKNLAAEECLLIDSHMHVFDIDIVPASGNHIRYRPKESALFEVYHRLAEAVGISGCLIVQPSFLGYNNNFVLGEIDRVTDWDYMGAVVMLPPDRKSLLAEYASIGVAGIRLNLLERSEEELQFPRSVWGQFWEQLNSLGMHVEIHVESPRLAGVLEQIAPYVERIVLDHFALPHEGRNGAIKKPPEIYRFLTDRFDLERFWIKTSGPYRVFPNLSFDEAVDACTALVTMLAEFLPPDHLLWGSDWPYTRSASLVKGDGDLEKMIAIASTYSIWTNSGRLYDPDKAFFLLTGELVRPVGRKTYIHEGGSKK